MQIINIPIKAKTMDDCTESIIENMHGDNCDIDILVKKLFTKYLPDKIYEAIERFAKSENNDIFNHKMFFDLRRTVAMQEQYLKELDRRDNINRTTIEGFETQIRDFNKVRVSMCLRITDAEEEIAEINRKTKLLHHERDQLSTIMSELNIQNMALKSDVSKSKSAMKDWMSQLSTKRNKLSDVQETMKKIEQELDERGMKIRQMQHESSNMHEDILAAKDKLRELASTHERMIEETRNKHDAIVTSRTELEFVTHKNMILTRELEAAMINNEEMQAKFIDVTQKLDHICHEYNERSTHYQMKSKQLREIFAQIGDTDKKLQRASHVLSGLYAQLAEAHQERAEANEKEIRVRNKIIQDIVKIM